MLYQEVEIRPEAAGEPADDAGDFEAFYRTRAPSLRRYAVAVAGRESADDACQEAWLRIWRAWGSAEPERVDAWARQIVRNCCLSGRRVNGPSAPVSVMVEPLPEPDEVVVRRAEVEQLARCIERLPGHLRDTLWLREVLGHSYADIATTLDIPIGTVMSRLHTARRKLARRLGR
jgi:RNA polymerase sigma-70 factor (ECF subfamily)